MLLSVSFNSSIIFGFLSFFLIFSLVYAFSLPPIILALCPLLYSLFVRLEVAMLLSICVVKHSSSWRLASSLI